MIAAGEPARAQDDPQVVAVATVEPARLEYIAAPGCHDEATFHHAVASHMKGADPFDASSAVVLRVVLKKVPGGYRGTVQRITAKGEPWPEEDWTGSTCEQVFRDIALAASLDMRGPPKPIAPPEEPPPEGSPDLAALPPLPAPESPSEPEKAPPAARPRVPPPARPSPSPRVVARSLNLCGGSKEMNLSIGLSGLLLMTAGYSDNVGPAFGLGLECRGMPPAWNGFGLSLSLEFRGVPPARVTAREPLDAAKPTIPQPVDVSTWSGLVVPCLRFAKYFSACVAGQLGAIVLKGPVQTTSDWTGTLGPRLGVEIPFADRFAVLGLGEALFNLQPKGVGFKDPPLDDPKGTIANVFWREPVVSGFVGAGMAVRFE